MKITLARLPKFVAEHGLLSDWRLFNERLMGNVCISFPDGCTLSIFAACSEETVLKELGTFCRFFNIWRSSKEFVEFMLTDDNGDCRVVTLYPMFTPVICGLSLSGLNLETAEVKPDLWDIQMTFLYLE